MSVLFNSAKTAETINRAIANNQGTTTTEQGASAAGLIIKEDLQPVVQCVTGFDYKIVEKTISGSPPLTFHAVAQYLTDWSIDGNEDSGDYVGEKTINDFDKTNYIDLSGYYISNLRILYAAVDTVTLAIPCKPSTQYVVQRPTELPRFAIAFSNTDQWVSNLPLTGFAQNNSALYLTSTSDVDSEYILIYYGKTHGDGASTPEELSNFISGLMIFEGTEPITSYIPYGYEIPITNANVTYTVYISDVLRKSSGEDPVYDVMYSDGTIIRRVDTDGTPLETPTTETYTAPDIIVNWGWNTIDVDTTVTPSSMTINYKDD